MWFLLVTLCSINPGQLADNCNDYVIDSGLSYIDCRDAIAQFPFKENLFSLRCDRGEEVEPAKEDK